MEKPIIRKYKSWNEVPKNDLDFWLTKTPAERLAALEALREQILWIKPEFRHERPLPTLYSIVKRTS
ncbi:MAG: hypothetical protein LH606_20755 [Cytophagaceae bacterium]|nr:hypothetical protein [Cytophagaceae bacterium]